MPAACRATWPLSGGKTHGRHCTAGPWAAEAARWPAPEETGSAPLCRKLLPKGFDSLTKTPQQNQSAARHEAANGEQYPKPQTKSTASGRTTLREGTEVAEPAPNRRATARRSGVAGIAVAIAPPDMV